MNYKLKRFAAIVSRLQYFLTSASLRHAVCFFIILTLLAAAKLTSFYQKNDTVFTVYAQSGGYSGTGGEVFCRTGSRDWESFISSLISYDGLVEYWKDILVRYNTNICLYNDIDSLLRRLDKARKQIRTAFFNCDIRADDLRKSYYKLEAELYFVRNYVDASKDNLLFKNAADLKNKFIDRFVNDKKFLSQDEAKNYFEEFFKRYQERRKVYLECSDPAWTNLIAKWNEFKENAGGFAAIKEAAETIDKKAQKVLNTPRDRTGNFLGGLLDLRINDLDPETAWSDIAADLKRNFPAGYTFEQLQAATDSEKQRHEANTSRAEFLTQYEHLYKESSGNIVNEITARLDDLDEIIRNTGAGVLPQTHQCVKTVINKTC